jgi:hypothetical protein
MRRVHIYGVYETEWDMRGDSSAAATGPVAPVVFTGPSGQEITVRGFWDGGSTWRVRFSPEEEGTWRWHAAGSGDATGQFDCIPYEGDNSLYAHGPLRVSADGHHLEHGDGTPFFWLGDTAWNGVIRGDDANWERFLAMRVQQRFTVAQFVCSHWRGDAEDEFGETACTVESPMHINPAFFKRLDRRVAMINAHGLVAAPVVLWSLLESDIGYKLPEADAIALAGYIVARYDAYQVVWLLGGDGNYQKMGVDRWKRIGRAVYSVGHNRLVTLHPCGVIWIGEEFRDEPWYDIVGYQSGHGDSEEDLCWLVQGPPAAHWQETPTLPVINLEPNYETAHGYRHKTVFTDLHVRRAVYWSLLVSPTAGVTYGHDAIWNWNSETGPSEGHGNWHDGAVPPWHTGLDTPGIRSMTVLRGILDKLPWTGFVPSQEVLAAQPGEKDPAAFIAVARAGTECIAVYTPCGGRVELAADACVPAPAWVVDPVTGSWHTLAADGAGVIDLPAGRDWLLVWGVEP